MKIHNSEMFSSIFDSDTFLGGAKLVVGACFSNQSRLGYKNLKNLKLQHNIMRQTHKSTQKKKIAAGPGSSASFCVAQLVAPLANNRV